VLGRERSHPVVGCMHQLLLLYRQLMVNQGVVTVDRDTLHQGGTDISHRKAILKRTGQCFVCLKRHHVSKDCRSSVRCAHFSGWHHTSICDNGHTSTKGDGDKQRSDSRNHTSSSPASLSQPPTNQQTPLPLTNQQTPLPIP